jgi:hypothetical protein
MINETTAMGVPLDGIAHIIQVALTPVFLLSGIASLLNVINARLGRIRERAASRTRSLDRNEGTAGPRPEGQIRLAGLREGRAPRRTGARLASRLSRNMTELTRHLDVLPAGQMVMLKLTIPDTPDRYRSLTTHKNVARVVALSGGYSRDEGCQRLTGNRGMIASFSRALTEGLHHRMGDAAFDAAISLSIGEIYRASTVKH